VRASRYDEALAGAVEGFQARHGVEPDGVLGPHTLAALNVPARRRIRQLELAMERLRWLPEPRRRVVYVEVPRARLWALDPERGTDEVGMKVVVGGAGDHATPMLAVEITGVVFRPYWVPTKEIVAEEIVPRERARPGWLSAHDMEIVASAAEDAVPLPPDEANLEAAAAGRLRVRQRPGPRNDLGPVKLIVPNPACIGLHGTPHARLFERTRRDRSHGCIRLEDPVALAEWLLRSRPGWDRARIAAALRERHPTGVLLGERVSLAVVYATASVDADGREHFLEDIYGADAALDEAMRSRPPRGPGHGRPAR
jgi:murein L,D-transpeptidase YcbB/YkuD